MGNVSQIINRLLGDIKKKIIDISSNPEPSSTGFKEIEKYYSEYNTLNKKLIFCGESGYIKGLLNQHNGINFSKASALYIKKNGKYHAAASSGSSVLLESVNLNLLEKNNKELIKSSDTAFYCKIISTGNIRAIFIAASNSLYFNKNTFYSIAEILKTILSETSGESINSLTGGSDFELLKIIEKNKRGVVDTVNIKNIDSILLPDYTNNILKFEQNIEKFFKYKYPDTIENRLCINPGYHLVFKNEDSIVFNNKTMNINVYDINIICHLNSYTVTSSNRAYVIEEIIRQSSDFQSVSFG